MILGPERPQTVTPAPGARKLAYVVSILVLLAGTASAQPPTLELLDPTPRPQDANWEMANAFGFSVVHSAGQYRLYATNRTHRIRWNQTFDGFEDLFFTPGACNWMTDPLTWDARCIDAIGLFWKNEACVGNEPCEWTGHWNAYPGTGNISIYPVPWLWPRQWATTLNHGTNGFSSVIDRNLINSVTLQPQRTSCVGGVPVCPPATGAETTCHRFNQNTWATGAANGKVVEVKYLDGTRRWFMALNKMVHVDHDVAGGAADRWSVLWAYSNDGKTWTIHPQVLFRDVTEAQNGATCFGTGLLTTNMLTDGGYFYLTMTRLQSNKVYLLRSAIGAAGSVPGYTGGWQIVSGLNGSGNWVWSNVTLGQQLNFLSLGYNVMQLPPGTSTPIRQAAIGRVFTSATPGSKNRYVGLAAELQNGQPAIALYTADSLATGPFTRRSMVDLSLLTVGLWVLEFGFTYYADNSSATPRLLADQLDFWIVTNKSAAAPWDTTRMTTVDRFTARVQNLGN